LERHHVFPEGVAMYTAGDPRSQPVMMHLLVSRILSGTAPQWTKEMRQGWADQIDGLRRSFEAAVEAHRPLEAAAIIARGSYTRPDSGGPSQPHPAEPPANLPKAA
jgi:hypothetical protein